MLFDRNHAIETPKVDQWETLDHRWKHDRSVGENPETHGTAVYMGARPDAIDSLSKEAKRARKSEKRLLRARNALEPSTQKAAIAHERRRLAEEATLVAKSAFVDPGSRGTEPPDKVPQEQTTFGECEGEPGRS